MPVMNTQSPTPRDPVRRLLFTAAGELIGEIIFGMDEDRNPKVYVETPAGARFNVPLDDLIPQKRHFVLRSSTTLDDLLWTSRTRKKAG